MTVQEKRDWIRKRIGPSLDELRRTRPSVKLFTEYAQRTLDHGSDAEIEHLWETIFKVGWEFAQRHEKDSHLSP